MLTLEMQKKTAKSQEKTKISEGKTADKKFSFDEVYTVCLKYFKGDELAATTWMNKYAMKAKDGNFFELTPDDMHLRMAKEFGRKEKN